jgi:hypothetical protein
MLYSCVPVYAQSTTWAILRQTAIQTAEHLSRLEKAIEQVEVLRSQLDLAIEAAEGAGSMDFVSEFRNLVIETTDILSELDAYISETGDVSAEWLEIYGTLTDWIEDIENFEHISMSDDMNAVSYKIADSYQDVFKRNSEYAQRFISHAKTVNEKGALKEIAEELGHLMQMQNHVTYLMSQQIKQQSVESSNRNLERKEEAVELKKENEGVRRLMGAASRDFAM